MTPFRFFSARECLSRSAIRMMVAGWLLGAMGLAAGVGVVPDARGQDVDLTKHITLRLQETPDGLELASTTEVTKRLLTRRAAEGRILSVVPEPFFSTIRDLEGTVNGEAVPEENVTETSAQPRNVFISGLRLHRIQVDRKVGKGDVVGYSYRQTYTDPAYAPVLRVPNANRLAGFDVAVEHPADVQVDFEEVVFGEDVDPVVERPSDTLTTLRIDTLAQRTVRPYDPHSSLQAAFLPVIRRGDEAVTPSTTGAFTDWYRSLIPERNPLTASERAFVDSLMQDAATTTDSVRALYDFARRQVRYIADTDSFNAIVPRPPREVVRRRYGDCKDKAYFIAQTARAVGLDVHMALVNTAPALPFEHEHVSLYNHVINAVRTEDASGEAAWTFVDPTHRYLPYGDLPASDVGRRALVLEGEDPRRVFIPPPSGAPSLEIDVETTLADPSVGAARVTLRHGLFAGALRAQETQTAVDFENRLSTLVNDRLYRMTIDRFRIVDTTQTTMTLAARADVSDFVIASPTRRYVPKTPFQVVDSDVLDRTDDTAPLALPYTPPVALTMTVGTDGFAADSSRFRLGPPGEGAGGTRVDRSHEPSRSQSATPAAGYGLEARAVPDSSSVRIQYRYRPFPRRPTGATRTRYLDFADAYLDAKSNMFIFPSTDSDP